MGQVSPPLNFGVLSQDRSMVNNLRLVGSYPINDLSIMASFRRLSWMDGVRRTGYKWGETSRSRKAFS